MSKVLKRDPNELWKAGLSAIDDNIEVMRDDLHDKGWTDEAAIQSVLNRERASMTEELSRNIEGDFSDPNQYGNYADLNDTNDPDESVYDQEEQASDLIDDDIAYESEWEEQASDLYEDAGMEESNDHTENEGESEESEKSESYSY